MSIRWKLFIPMLLVTIVPLLVVATLNRREMSGLGRDLSRAARESIIRRTTSHISQRIRDHATLLRQRQVALEHSLRSQAREVEKRLTSDQVFEGPVFTARDFDEGRHIPEDTAPSEKHFRFVAAGGPVPLKVSYSAVAVVLTGALERDAVGRDIDRLVLMANEYHFLYDRHRELVYWQYTGLENGVYVSYPGHGGYPAGFDHRQREWYRAAARADGPVWIGPYFDASSEQLISTVCMPVRRPEGTFAGVTGIDVTQADLVRMMRIPDFYREAQSLLVVLQPATDEEPDRLRILVRPGFHRKGQPWDTLLEDHWLSSDDAAGQRRLIRDMSNGASGTVRLSFHGRECYWIYGPIEQKGMYLVNILPVDEVLAEAAGAERTVLDRTDATLRLAGVVAAVAMLAAIGVSLVFSRSVTRPIRELAATARLISEGELDARARVWSGDEIGELARTFNSMLPQLQERLQLKQSIKVGREIQQHLLPSESHSSAGFEIAGQSIYCAEMGGDYFDFIECKDAGRLAVALGDVSGHGIDSALLMASARALIRRAIGDGRSAADVTTGLNEYLAADSAAGRLMTLFLLFLDDSRRTAVWVSAGHDAAITYHPGRDEFGELAGDDVILGVDASWRYAEHGPVRLDAGTIVVIGTDGIWETRNEAGEFYGKERLRNVIRASNAAAVREIGAAIIKSVTRYRGGGPAQDDLTQVIIRVT